MSDLATEFKNIPAELLKELMSFVEGFSAYNIPGKFGELKECRVVMVKDPFSNLSYFSEKLQVVQGYKDRVMGIHEDLIKFKLGLDRLSTILDEIYTKKKTELFSGNKEVQELKNNDLRLAKVDAEIPDVKYWIHILKLKYDSLEEFLKLIQREYENLDSANTNISRQLKASMFKLAVEGFTNDKGEKIRYDFKNFDDKP